MSDWKQVTKADPCPSCGKPDHCAWAPNGNLRCMRNGETPRGMQHAGNDDDGGTIYRPADNCRPQRERPCKPTHPKPCVTDLDALQAKFCGQLTPTRLQALADATHVSAEGWRTVEPGWATREDLRVLKASGADWGTDYPDGAWSIPNRDGKGRIVGFEFRALDGRKGAPAGMKRGLTVPNLLGAGTGAVYVVEGPSDVAAAHDLGLRAVGRPNNQQGAEDLATMLDGATIIVVGENDLKTSGAWPGRDGAKGVAERIVERGCGDVRWAIMPDDAKDVRRWLEIHGPNSGVMLVDRLAKTLRKPKAPKSSGPSTADELVRLALELYRFGRAALGEAFAVERSGPNVAISLRGGAGSLRSRLAKRFRERTGRTPGNSALADAMTVLEANSLDVDAEPVAVRIAAMDDGAAIDLGDERGRAVVVTPEGWRVVERSPVLFRRTAISGRLPEPSSEACEPRELLRLRTHLNVSAESWPLVVGWLVAGVRSGIAHPVLLFGGHQGAGKSTAARYIAGLLDPSEGLLRSQPRDEDSWAVIANTSYGVVLDNVSAIPAWLSDALCKAVTGSAWIKRMLYTDGDPVALCFRRCILLTSIELGSLRGDLADRILLVDLESIPSARRREESKLDAAYAADLPRILAGLYSAVAATLQALPGVALAERPRMADFATTLAALDRACPELTEGRALSLYLAQSERIAIDVVDSDPFIEAFVEWTWSVSEWRGTASQLLSALPTPEGETRSRGWPRSAANVGQRLTRFEPALRQLGIDVQRERAGGGMRTRLLTVRRIARASVPPVPIVPNAASDGPSAGTERSACDLEPSRVRPASSDGERGRRDGGDARDG